MATLEVGVARQAVGLSGISPQFCQPALEGATESLLDQFGALHDKAGHVRVVAIVMQQGLELALGFGEEQSEFAQRVFRALGPFSQELPRRFEQALGGGVAGLAKRFQFGAVDRLLVVVLAELHRLVKESSHREVEHCLERHFLPRCSEESVTTLLQTEEDAVLGITDEGLNIAKLEGAGLEGRCDSIQGGASEQEVAHDSHEVHIEFAISHAGSIRSLAVSQESSLR